MNIHYAVGLVGFLVVLALALTAFVNIMVDRRFRGLARAGSDGEFRRGEIARLDARLAKILPIPGETPPLPPRRRVAGMAGAATPALLTLGMILFWGSGAAPEERTLWLAGGALAVMAALGIMLSGLKRRRLARTAGLLLFRADLRRMDGDREGAAADLGQLLRLTPWDDSAWAELADDLAETGDLEGAFRAMEEASALDRGYDEYHMGLISLALRLGLGGEARRALDDWRDVDGMEADDPRLGLYRAAIEVAEGRREAAKTVLADIGEEVELEHCSALLASDKALDEVWAMLPLGTARK